MIGSLRGTLEDQQQLGGGNHELLLDVGGVGYRVVVGPRTAARLPEAGSELALRVHTHVRESAIALYGFASAGELACFELLLGAHGVGPALALAVLGALRPEELARAVTAGDIEALSRVPGVGRKTAARLIVDLGPRFESGGFEARPVGVATPGDAAIEQEPDPRRQVGEALAGLGYGSDEVRAALERLPDEGGVEELLRAALATFAPAALR